MWSCGANRQVLRTFQNLTEQRRYSCLSRSSGTDLPLYLTQHTHPHLYQQKFSFLGGLGEADQGGGDSPHQVLQPVEEAEGEGNPAGDLRQRQGKYPTAKKQKQNTNLCLILLSHDESRLAFFFLWMSLLPTRNALLHKSCNSGGI